MAEPLFHAREPGGRNARIGTVWQRPVTKDNGDGSTSTSMGFRVCDCNEFVEGAATAIADALNVVEGGPVAWRFELAAGMQGGKYDNWQPPQVSLRKPSVPSGAVRNLTPLYAGPVQD